MTATMRSLLGATSNGQQQLTLPPYFTNLPRIAQSEPSGSTSSRKFSPPKCEQPKLLTIGSSILWNSFLNLLVILLSIQYFGFKHSILVGIMTDLCVQKMLMLLSSSRTCRKLGYLTLSIFGLEKRMPNYPSTNLENTTLQAEFSKAEQLSPAWIFPLQISTEADAI